MGSGSASAEYNLLNCSAGCLADLNRMWSRDCTVLNKFRYHSSFLCYDRYFCPWNVNEFSCFTFYRLTRTRTWTRRHEFYTLPFHVTSVLQINPHRNLHGPHNYQCADLAPLPSSSFALSPIHRSNTIAIIIVLNITTLS